MGAGATAADSVCGPVWPGTMADPFVLRHDGGLWAYGTAPRDESDGREFRVLRSDDLATWEHVGGALCPLDDAGAAGYWAPEVVYHEGRFLMFYSSGGPQGQGHRLRVATSPCPQGPFVDQGALLPGEPFSIDAHPFVDPASGRRFLFYARDRLDDACPGTGIAVVEMAPDFLTPLGEARDVVRPSAPWHVFERDRRWMERVWPAWHTIEGPAVVLRGGRYWMTYSGGPYWAAGYGVGCAVATTPEGPWQDLSTSGPTVLGTLEGRLLGPGHNSVVAGADGRDFIVFHAWNPAMTARRMHVAPLEWTESGPVARIGLRVL